jgi:hypothetical protein
MDDIRRPHQPQRRDYALPAGRPPAPQPHHRPHPAPAHQSGYRPQLAQAPEYQPHYPQPPVPPAHHQPLQPAAAHHPAAPQKTKTSKRFGSKLSIAAGGLIAAVAIFGAGYLLKGTGPQDTIPSSITRQVNYSLYFPSPMPPGYTYMKQTATFEIGDVFYKFSNGTKRVTVKEEPLNGNKPDLSLLAGYARFDLPFGQAAIGTSIGQPAAVVVTNSTVISLNGVGGVTQNDLKAAINNFKNIGQNTQKS